MQIDHVEFNVFKNQNGGCASVQWPCPAGAGVQAVAKFLYAKVIRSALIRGKLKAGELPPLQDGDEALANFEPQALKVDGAPAPEQMFSPFERELIDQLRDMTPEMREAMMTLAKRK